MIVYRLAKSKYINDLSGKGAEKTGGRWNSKGIAIVYTSESRALCLAEIAVHVSLGIVPKDYEIATIEIPDPYKTHEIKIKDLPNDWHTIPHSGKTQEIGDRLIRENKHLILKVPSAVVPGDFNYLINPNHKDFSKLRIIKTEPFGFDDRLFFK